MEGMYISESLKSEIEELKSCLTTVTEAMILFQEFIEQEIGEMSYFRDSGSYYKLVETLNKMRVRTLKVASPVIKQSEMIKTQQRHSMEMETRMCYDMEDDEQVEVDVDFNDDDPVDEITIRQVYSVPSPIKHPSETSFQKSSSVTITPVYSEDRKREQQQFVLTQPSLMLVDKNGPSTPQFVSREPHPFMVGEQSRLTPAMKFDAKDHERMLAFNKNLGPPVPNVPLAMTMANLPPPPPVYTTSTQSNKAFKNGNLKKSLLRMNTILKKKPRRVEKSSFNGEYKSENGIDQPLNLKKKLKRPSECPVKCSFCGKCYSSKGVMSRHIKEAHKAEPQFPCFYCKAKFRNGPLRLEHMNTHHPEDITSVICPYCKRKSSSVAGKRNHMMLCARKHRIVVGGAPAGNPSPTKTNLAFTPDSEVKMGASSSG